MIYTYNDMVSFILFPTTDIDWGITWIYKFLTKFVSINILNNLLIIIFIFLSWYFSFLLFKVLKVKKTSSIFFASLYTLSVYSLYRIISFTPGLYPVFIFPVLVYCLIKITNPILISLCVLSILLFSNYYGFFSFVLVGLWYLSDLILKKIKISGFFKKMFFSSLPLVLGLAIFFFPLLKNNLPFLGNYTDREILKSADEQITIYRPLEDWYNLSFRPWYFFIPPKSSIFFGEFSKNIHKKIESTNYYLADDYMEEEMAGSYMGWHFLLGLGTVAVILLLKKYKNIEFKTFQNVYKNKEMIIRSFFIIFCILLISGPPSFTISGVEIYTPTYLLYYIIPVFRTLVRWAVVIYLFVLIINSFLVQDLYNLMKTKFQKILFILSFLTLNFVIFAIEIPVININKPPEEIAFVKEKYPESVPYAVYPKGDYYSIFWIISHEDLLINPVNFVNYETGFDSNEFSKNLITQEGIQEFLKQNPKYLIYYPNNISDDDLERITKINPTLKTKEDIYEFFKSKFGDGLIVGESVVFNIGD